MRFRILSLACLVGLTTTVLTARTPLMPLSEVRPGMTGVGRTVFSGSEIEEFQVHILGVLANVIGPSRNLILARLEGGPLAKTGVIAGMSGSPVYVDGRLIGAVSYQLGQFPKEAIAGITPIAEMTEATALPAASQGARPVAIQWPPTPQALLDIWRQDLGRSTPISSAAAAHLAGMARESSAFLQPIAVPLVAAGLAPDVMSPLMPALRDRGFLPLSAASATGSGLAGATSSLAPGRERTLRPGDAMGVALLTGDFMLGATGTVTHVDGDRVYGFGHPMYNLGPTRFPLVQADVQVVLPSLMTSTKLASFGPTVGTVQQDRATAVAARLGEGPAMVPVNITLNSDRAPSRTFSFAMVRDHTFTPLLAYLTVANVLTSYERGVGPASYTVRGSATIREHGDIAFEDIFAGDQPASAASAYVAGPLTFLMKNAALPVDVEKIALTIDASEQSRTARIERVWLDTDRPRAGRHASVHVLLRTPGGDEHLQTVPIQIPANATGSMQLLVADAARVSTEDRRSRGSETQEVAQLIRTFNRARRSNRLYVRLSAPEEGAVVNGEPMTSLPPSVLAVLEADRQGGAYAPLRQAVRGEWELPVPMVVTGARQLTLTIDQP